MKFLKTQLKNNYIITSIYKMIKKPRNKNLSEAQKVFNQSKDKKRFVQEEIHFFNKNFIVPDAPSFAYQVKDIFLNECYKFLSDTPEPVIYDCGANIGTSVLWFKTFYPKSRVKAFEADRKIYEILEHNVANLEGVELFFNAVWINDKEISFNVEGADGGSLVNTFTATQKVKAIRLKNLLAEETCVDFLKIDIEGAETAVIEDCSKELTVVKNIFIEYHSMITKKQDLDKILAVLSTAGFRYHIESITGTNAPFINRNVWNNMDLQLNIFAYRNF